MLELPLQSFTPPPKKSWVALYRKVFKKFVASFLNATANP
jgi:hypothetical protein